jgi:ankyrin repeat protein
MTSIEQQQQQQQSQQQRHKNPKDIFEAVEQDNQRAVKHFIEKKGVPVGSVNYRLQTAAHIAATRGNLKILKYIVEKDSSILAEVDLYGHNALFVAIDNDHLDIVKYLIGERAIDLCQRYRSYAGNTVIHQAAELGRLAILKYLIEKRNGDVNLTNELKEPPLFLAARNKHFHVVRYLVEERKANLTALDDNERTILHIAVDNDDLTLMKYVLDERKANLDVDRKGKFGITLVQRAADLNRLEVLVYLVDKKHADINTVNDWGESPLHSAARENYYEVCKYLVEHGANTQTKDRRGRHPIQDTTDERIFKCVVDATLKRSRRSIGTQRKQSEPFAVPIDRTSLSDVFSAPAAHHSVAVRSVVVFRAAAADIDAFSLFAINDSRFTIASPFQNFLTLAKSIIPPTWCSIRAKRSSHFRQIQQRQQPAALMSLRDILLNKIDPVALDAML